MRTFILLCIVALAVACGVGYTVGLFEIATEHSAGKYVVSLTINTSMLGHHETAAPDNIPLESERVQP